MFLKALFLNFVVFKSKNLKYSLFIFEGRRAILRKDAPKPNDIRILYTLRKATFFTKTVFFNLLFLGETNCKGVQYENRYYWRHSWMFQ
jgi:hypothetical protein